MPNALARFRTAPQVTIAMVTYNSGRFVREAIQSVLAQDFDDFELLVCDDRSTDDTWEIVKGFDDRRIRAVRNEDNIGEYPNRNRALQLARGQYVMYLDGDDILYPHGLGFMVRTLARFPHAGFASAMAPCEKFIYPVELTPHQFCSCAWFGPNVLTNDFTQLFFRTEALRALGGFDLRYRSGDTHVQFALGMRRNVVLMGAGLAWWRRRRGQASEALRGTGESLREMWRYCRELLEHRDCPLDEEEKSLARENLSRQLLRSSVRMMLRGNIRGATRVALRTGIPAGEWSALFGPYKKPFLSTVSGENPIHLGLGMPVTFVPPPPRARVRTLPVRLANARGTLAAAPVTFGARAELAEQRKFEREQLVLDIVDVSAAP